VVGVREHRQGRVRSTTNTLIVGPWCWRLERGCHGNVLGNLRWGYKTGPFFRDSVEYVFSRSTSWRGDEDDRA